MTNMRLTWIAGSLYSLLWLGGSSLGAQPITQARIMDIPTTPVFGRQPPALEKPAQLGTEVVAGGYFRTMIPGKAQLKLSNGLSVRLGGNAVLRIGPTLRLDQGKMIAWFDPGRTATTSQTIETPVGIAAIKGTTVFIDIQDQDIRFFSWEGEVQVIYSPTNQQVPVEAMLGKTFILRSGQEIRFPLGKVQSNPQNFFQVRAMPSKEVSNRFRTSSLLNGFSAPMATLETIRQILKP